MTMLIEIASLAAIKAFLIGIPESAGILVFGIALISVACFIRWLLARGETNATDPTIGKKA